MKYWWDNLDDDEKMTAYALLGIVVVIIGITLFFAIPRNEKMKHCKIQWQWTVQLQEYRICNESKWGTIDYDYSDGKEHILGQWDGGYVSPLKDHAGERNRVVPAAAYDVTERVEFYEDRKVSDGEDSYHYEKVYRYKYYYKINRWCNSNILAASGFDKQPHEPECDLPTYIQDPQIGDKIRQGGHNEKYTVTGTIGEKQKTLNLTFSQWSDLQDNATIYYKRRPLSSEIKDMQIGK